MVKTWPSNAGGAGLIPGWGAKIPHASRTKNQNIKQKQYCNKFNKDFKNVPNQKKKNLKRKWALIDATTHQSPWSFKAMRSGYSDNQNSDCVLISGY